MEPIETNSTKDSAISKLIYHLKILKKRNAPITRQIPNFNLLMMSLAELEGMIEMEDLKESVAKQVKFLLINNNNNDGHMLHTVLYGPPGVGKTKVCTILIKIWISLGAIKSPNSTLTNTLTADNANKHEIKGKIVEQVKNLMLVSQIKTEVILNLQKIIADLKQKVGLSVKDLKQIREQITYLKTQSAPYDLYERVNSKNHRSVITLNKMRNQLDDIIESWKGEVKKYDLDEKVFFITEEINLANLVNSPSNQDHSNQNQTDHSNQHQTPGTDHAEQDKQEGTEQDLDDMVKIVGRSDFCGGYMGQSALKTEALLLSSLGKVLFIDEAYSLVHDETDSYGKEALTELNTFMTERSDELVVIFAGYKNLMEQTIFKFQPGLKSRCTWMFEIADYSAEGLAQIFIKQAKEKQWIVDPDFNVVKFFEKYKKDFPAFGRDTNRLLFYCKLCYSDYIFDNELDHNKVLTKTVVKCALEYLRTHRIQDADESSSNLGMYL